MVPETLREAAEGVPRVSQGLGDVDPARCRLGAGTEVCMGAEAEGSQFLIGVTAVGSRFCKYCFRTALKGQSNT